MKTSLKITALLLAASFPCVAFAEMLGASVPSFFNMEIVSALIAVVLIGLTVIGDYSHRCHSSFARSYCRFANRKGETHRLAA
jgi:hypothetical protein